MSSMYKFLLKKRVEITFNKERLRKFDPKCMLSHFERFMRKVYDGIVQGIRGELTRLRVTHCID